MLIAILDLRLTINCSKHNVHNNIPAVCSQRYVSIQYLTVHRQVGLRNNETDQAGEGPYCRQAVFKKRGHIRKFSLRHNLVIFLRNTLHRPEPSAGAVSTALLTFQA